jgi:hypothetical protein
MTMRITKKDVTAKGQLFFKFALLCALLAGYFLYLWFRYDLATGGIASLLTWSFFVLCTPIADAGFLLDFPLRLIFGIRMLVSEIVVWAVAISINIVALFYFPHYYETTKLTVLFHAILTTPVPYWSVILLSGMGTFLSIQFADEILDVFHHRDRKFFHRHGFKHEILVILFFLLALAGYLKLVASLGLELKA